jgi:hypothetical protein
MSKDTEVEVIVYSDPREPEPEQEKIQRLFDNGHFVMNEDGMFELPLIVDHLSSKPISSKKTTRCVIDSRE